MIANFRLNTGNKVAATSDEPAALPVISKERWN
jgi:hypothetical protein